MDCLNLNKTQKRLLYTAMSAIIVQNICIFYFLEDKKTFKCGYSFGYILFSTIAYIFYYRLVIP